MASPDIYADFVEFTVKIVAGSLLGLSLARCCMVDEFAATDAFPNRTKIYTGTPTQIREALVDDGFATTTSTYKMVSSFVNNIKPIGEVMVGRIDATDPSYVDGLTAIAAEDDSFFGFCIDTRNKARQMSAFEWAQEKKTKFYITTTADPLALDEDPNSLPLLAETAEIEYGMVVWYDPAAATKYGPAIVTSSPGTFKVPNNGTLILSVAGGADQTFTFLSAAASILSGSDGTYAITPGGVMYVRVNQGDLYAVTFEESATYFPDTLASASADQVAAFLNDQVPGLDATSSGLKLLVRTAQRGTGAHVEVFGDPAVELDLAVSEFLVRTGTVTASNGDTVGIVIDGLASADVVSTASASATALLLKAAIQARADLMAKLISVETSGADVILTFNDHSSHTTTSNSPNTADVSFATTNAAVDAEVDGTGFAVNADAATSTEVAALIDATLTGADAAAVGAKFTLTSTAYGETAEIEVVGGTLVDEFGLSEGPVAGTGTLENYLDCQILGRVAGFDLDAPNGSIGWDNQTVPQTPGNTLTNSERKALWKHNCNTYERVTSNRPGELHRGVCPAGFDCDVVWSAFWFRVRGSERVKTMQDNMAAQGQRIPYTEAGIAKYDQVLRTLMQDGARNGHIQGPELRDKDPLGIRKAFFHTPTIAEQTTANRANSTIAGWETYQLATGSAKAIKIDMTIQTP